MRQPKKADAATIAIYAVIGIALLYVCAGLGACMDINTDENGKIDLAAVMNGLETAITNYSLVFEKIKARGMALKMTVFGLFAEGIYVLMKVTDKKKLHRRGEEHGSARWGNDKERKSLADKPKKKKTKPTAEQKNREKQKKIYEKAERKISGNKKLPDNIKMTAYVYKPDNNIILTNDVKMSLNTRQTRKNLNVCVIGGSGSGKSRFYVKPNLMQANTSYVSTDPKGELLRATGKFLNEQGYEIKVFNLIDMAHSNNYNPFAYIYDAEGKYSETAVIKMINVLMQNTKKEGGGGDQFWDDSTQTLLSALCFYLIEVEDESKRNFSEVMKLLKMAEVKEGSDDFQSDLDLVFDALDNPDNYLTDEATENSDNKRLGLAEIAKKERPETGYMCTKYYKDFKKAAGDTAKSILISTAVRLQAFNLPKVMDLTCCDNLELNLIGDRKTAVFIVIPSSDNTFNFLAAMMYTQMFDVLYDSANFRHGGRLPVHVRCLLDEFANIGQIPRFEELLATMRSMEISANIILQNLSQLKKMYKDSWENVIGNCDSMLFLGGQEPTTLEHISKMLGKETIDTVSRSRSKGKNSSSSTNDGILGRELMTIDELKVMKDDECILFVRGIFPFFSKKFKIESHVNYKRLEDSNKAFAYDISDINAVKAEIQNPEKEKENTKESVSEEETVTDEGAAAALKVISAAESLGSLIAQSGDDIPDNIPTEFEDEDIGSQEHIPLTEGNNQKEFKSSEAKVDSTDTPVTSVTYNKRSEYDNVDDDIE
ncbi:MAG: type IV secretory system conjugative DNA transfer family protein [Ruminococcus sp.]|nr:type IV secretory system conjugative DNA transfer family protein [Ruminococcus sp.]